MASTRLETQLVDIESDPFNVRLYDTSTVLVHDGLANLLILCPASLLLVWLALIVKYHLLHLVAVRVFVDVISPQRWSAQYPGCSPELVTDLDTVVVVVEVEKAWRSADLAYNLKQQ